MVSEPELSEQDSGGDTMQHELDSAPSGMWLFTVLHKQILAFITRFDAKKRTLERCFW